LGKNEEEEKMMKRVQIKWLIVSCLAVIVSVVLTSTASATILGTVNIQNHNNSLSDTGNLWGGGLSGGLYYTGIYSWTNEGGTDLGALVPNWGFCIELTQGPYTGWQNVISLDEAPQPVTAVTPMGSVKADRIRELWGRNFDPSWTTGANRQMAEAFGAALWEIVFETDSTWDVTSGAGFHATIEQAATSNLWLSQLNGDTTYFANNLVATSAPTGQDYLVQLPHMPEPVTVSLLGLGALSLLRRKR
jgi:hypothetical protein